MPRDIYYHAIREYLRANPGATTVADIMKATGITQPGTVRQYVRIMLRRGIIDQRYDERNQRRGRACWLPPDDTQPIADYAQTAFDNDRARRRTQRYIDAHERRMARRNAAQESPEG